MRKDKDQLTQFIAGYATPPGPQSEGEQWRSKRFTEKGFLFSLGGSPVRMYPGYSLPRDLTFVEVGRCLSCAQYLEPETNMLFYRSNQERKPLTRAKLAKRLGISYRQCCRFIERMIKYGVMIVEDGRIYVCPIYFFRGHHLRYALYDRFRDQMDKVLPPWVVDRYNGKPTLAGKLRDRQAVVVLFFGQSLPLCKALLF